MVTEVEKSYIAGMIDADGSINPQRPQVVVVNTYQPLIQWLADITGNGLQLWGGLACGPDCQEGHAIHHRKQRFRWRTSGSKALIVLNNISPYLREKRPLALQAIETFGIPSENRYIEPMKLLGWYA